jgi:hypothetical protein
MPHESTVDPEEPMHFKSWGDETSESDSVDRRRFSSKSDATKTVRLAHSLSIQTHPDLPLHVTHDHDDDGDPDDDNTSIADRDMESNLYSRVIYTPPKRRTEHDQE